MQEHQSAHLAQDDYLTALCQKVKDLQTGYDAHLQVWVELAAHLCSVVRPSC